MQKSALNTVQIIPTDTLYGIVAPAFDKEAVFCVYELKGRAPEKPCIILISALADLSLFNIHPDIKTMDFLNSVWPGPVSVILRCDSDNLDYLTRGTKSLAFRIPGNQKLLERLKFSGPLIAPSANPEGKEPARTITEARRYFGELVSVYEDGGVLDGPPSTLVDFRGDTATVLRQGAIRIQYKA